MTTIRPLITFFFFGLGVFGFVFFTIFFAIEMHLTAPAKDVRTTQKRNQRAKMPFRRRTWEFHNLYAHPLLLVNLGQFQAELIISATKLEMYYSGAN